MSRTDAENIINLNVKDNNSKEVTPQNVRAAIAAALDYAEFLSTNGPPDKVTSSVNFSYILRANHVLYKILILSLSGDTIKIGTTPGGSEIAFDINLFEYATRWYSVSVDLAVKEDTAIYVQGVSSPTTVIFFKLPL